KEERDRSSGQTSLFGLMTPEPGGAESQEARYPAVDEWPPKQKLAFEKEALGFYASGHPLDRYAADLRRFRATRSVDVQAREEWEEVSVAGIVSGYKEWPLKSGEGRMAVFQLEDSYGQVRVTCFAKPFAAHETLLKGDEPLLVTGKVKPDRR